MNIFGVGTSELILLLVIALLVAGPQRMIRWAFVLGQYVGKMKEMWSEVAAHLQKEFDDAGVDVKVPTEIPTRSQLQQQWQAKLREAAKPLTEPVKAASGDLKMVKTEAENLEPSALQSTSDAKPSTKPAQKAS